MLSEEVQEKATGILDDLVELLGGEEAGYSRGQRGLRGSDTLVFKKGLGPILTIDEMRSGSDWHNVPSGKLYIRVTAGYECEDAKRFNLRKNGTFKSTMISYIHARVDRAERRQANQNSAYAALRQVRSRLDQLSVEERRLVSAATIRQGDKRIPAIAVTIPLEKLDAVLALLEAA